MEGSAESVAAALTALAPALVPGAGGIAGLTRLTGGASLETWSFSCGGTRLILRRRGVQAEGAGETTLSLAAEAAVIAAAGAGGVPVAPLIRLCTPADGLGEAYVAGYVEGETLGRRIAQGEAFAAARDLLGRQAGAALAAIHATPPPPGLPTFDAAATLARYRTIWRECGLVRPAVEAALVWLADTLPEPVPPTLVHGDFRNGNLMVDAERGLVAVLDWELAHVGDPAEDFGWLSVPSWRFGVRGRAAGGFAALDDALAAYGPGAPSPERIAWWQAAGSLKWAVMSNMLYRAAGASVERMVIGRRLSEAEADLVAMLAAA